MGDLGGLSRQYLNHSHEASPACDWVARTFNAPLHVHADDAQAVSEIASVGRTFSERHHVGGDFEVIPVPGHTAGATAYLWDTGEHRVLFTGDTIFFSRGRWRAAVLDGVSDRTRYIESLELIRTLDFDVIMPGSSCPVSLPRASLITSSWRRRRPSDASTRSSTGCDAARAADTLITLRRKDFS